MTKDDLKDEPFGDNLKVESATDKETPEIFEVPYSAEKEEQLLRILGYY